LPISNFRREACSDHKEYPATLGAGACSLLVGDRPGAAQEIGKLYETRPPPGYAFIRVVAGSDVKASARLRIDAFELPVGENDVASRYRAVCADKPLKLSIDGATIGEGITPLPTSFIRWSLPEMARAGAASRSMKARGARMI
jgi:hypothetical protein